MSLRTLILIIINGLIFLVILMLSITFYSQFSKALDDRIFLQLNSIKTLKQVQVENLIKSEWTKFLNSKPTDFPLDSVTLNLPKSALTTSGIFDFTRYNSNGQTAIGLVSTANNQAKVKIIDYNKIKEILLERTGMGSTGESYLVGEDFQLRSQSRFMPEETPSKIFAKTIAAVNALSGIAGKAIIKDYRGVNVYSAYGPINISHLKLGILSEMDLSEVKAPLISLKIRLLGLIVLIMLIAVVLSLFLTRLITNPIINMQKSLKVMADGDYNQTNEFNKNSVEIKEMFDALDNLKKSLQ